MPLNIGKTITGTNYKINHHLVRGLTKLDNTQSLYFWNRPSHSMKARQTVLTPIWRLTVMIYYNAGTLLKKIFNLAQTVLISTGGNSYHKLDKNNFVTSASAEIGQRSISDPSTSKEVILALYGFQSIPIHSNP